jgi:predicted DNA-binding transcriptional regulator YafY
VSETTQRAFRLLALLQARPVWTGTELADRLGVTTRSIRRDVERLRELGYPVHATQGAGGGYQLGQGKALPPLLLDDEEAVAVAVSLRLAAGGTVAGASEAAVRTLTKLDQVMPARLRSEVRAIQDSIATLQPPGATVDGDILLLVARACRDTVRVRFGYRAHDGTTSERRVEPYRLVVVGPRWYLFAFDVDRDDWRTFRLDRVSDVSVTTWRYRPRPHDDPVSYVQRSVVSSPYRHTARVRVHAPAEVLAGQVAPRSAVVEPLDAGTSLLVAGADSLSGLAFHLAWLGHDFEVLEPAELREAMTTLADRLLRAASVGDNGGHEDEQAGGVQ